jgi:hypothetical protein
MRNEWTHLGGKCRCESDIDIREMFKLNRRIRAFLRAAMLMDLGLPVSQISDAIVRQATLFG